ncbi:MAG: 16S rRNA (guanine(527)-N(7))-methyltransferase RsmG [Bacteroidota bacterium]|nr:16S rRNA (guanine(527)-N(7))-methyltransferase RsmG [Bacteroidota bacterium]MDP4205225.1 16S rRNA (guanine(527)-N(7))-methyltransferase RsmG [Bacteroidota bacterium]
MDLIKKYFPQLLPEQIEKFAALDSLYREWNEKINVISRKDIDHLYERHVLHSLGIAKLITFRPGTRILDVGTGGGFPGIPLAILFPECEFLLVDSIGKKIQVVRQVASALGLKNLKAEHTRVEEIKEKFDFIVSRAVTSFPVFVGWVQKNVSKIDHNSIPNGILYLKGGDLHDELKGYSSSVSVIDLSDYFSEEFFETKKIIHLPI